MEPLELAHRYMECFYGDQPLELMESILADDLDFKGPLNEFNSAKDYLESLTANPPQGMDFRIINEYENEDSVCLIYLFSKLGVETYMAQYFEIKDGKISKIRLIFDTNQLKGE